MIGCGKSANRGFKPVTGTVSVKGAPLAGALVQFVPTAAPGEPGSARTDETGAYTVIPSRGGTGLPPGQYRVVISRMVGPDGKELPEGVSPFTGEGKETLPRVYSSPEETVLTATVPESGPAVIDFPLEIKKGYGGTRR